MKKCVLCTSDKELSKRVIHTLIQREIEVMYVVVSFLKVVDSSIKDGCELHKIRVLEGDAINYIQDAGSFDYLISFNYGKRIPGWLINKATVAINFHPAPLPEYQGCAVSSWGIIYGERKWGVTCHVLSEDFDKGDLIEVDRFDIDETIIKTGYDLSALSWKKSFEQFKRILEKLISGEELIGMSQNEGQYYSKADLDAIKKINVGQNTDDIERLINGLWNPPFEGAYIEINQKRFYLIHKEILDECGFIYDQYVKKLENGGVVNLRYADEFDYFSLYDLWSKEFQLAFSYEEYLLELMNEDIRILIGELDGELVGTCEINRIKRPLYGYDNFFLTNVCVCDKMKGKGVGSLLIDVVKKLAHMNKINAIELTCADYRQKAHKFYLRNVFTRKKTQVFIYERER